MKIEDIKIEDSADANYFIKKFFNNDYNKITMTQLEQLVLAVYTMGKKSGVSSDSAPDGTEPKPAAKAPAKADSFKLNERVKVLEEIETNPAVIESKPVVTAPPKTNTFKVNDRVKTIEDIEIGHSGEFISPDKVGIVTLIKGDTISVLYEVGEEGEMLEINFMFDKLEKAG